MSLGDVAVEAVFSIIKTYSPAALGSAWYTLCFPVSAVPFFGEGHLNLFREKKINLIFENIHSLS